jgi:raffinose/stachyose/melibiose transport system substrate-binding protein
VKIITWDNPPAVTALTKIDAEFQKQYPNIKVQLVSVANTTTGYATLLQTSVDSNSADIVSLANDVSPLPLNPTKENMSQAQYWATSNVFLPLNGQPWLHDFTNQALQFESYKGNVYSLFTGSYQRLVFYNKAIFAKYHLSVPDTYSQFMTLLKTLSADHVTPIWLATGAGASDQGTEFVTEPLMAELWQPYVPGHSLFMDLQTGSATWNNPRFVQVETEVAAIAKYFEPHFTAEPWLGAPGAFATGKAAMDIDGSWTLSSMQQANPNIQVGSFPLPGSNIASANQPIVQLGLNFAVLRNAPDKANALTWLGFFARTPIYEQYCFTTGISPSETTGTYTSFAAKALGSWLGKGVPDGTTMPPLTPTQGYYDTTTQFWLLQEAVMQGTTTPQKAAELIQSSWKK